MNNYRYVPIRDIGNIVTGKTPLTKKQEYYNGSYMFVSPTELHNDFIVTKTEKTLTDLGMNSIKANIIQGVSVLVGCIGWDMGNVALCLEKCATNQQINSITDIKEEFNPFYIYYWFKGKKEYLFSISSVTRTPILSKSDFADILIPIPIKEYQDKIANLLSNIDLKILNNNKINDNLAA